MTRLKVVTIAGTRPELIRLSRLIALLDQVTDHHFVYTGQNYNPQLSDVFFDDLEIRKPDTFFEVETSSFGATIADTIRKSEQLLVNLRPDAVVILGDTNSSMAAIPAERLGIPVYHLEAGNRSFDHNVPEEQNRRMVDHIATFNFAYTEHARRNLLSEGLEPRRVFVSGSPVAEVFDYYRPSIDKSDILKRSGLAQKGYLVASIHRQENVDFPARLKAALVAIDGVGQELGVPVVMSTHPRTRIRMAEIAFEPVGDLRFSEPLGYLDYLQLQKNAMCVISDSGTISEESSIVGFPSVILRDSMERPEALESGASVMAGMSKDSLLSAIKFVTKRPGASSLPSGYEVTDFSQRVASVILSTARIAPTWLNLITSRETAH